MYTGHVKYPLFFSDFNGTWIFSTQFRRIEYEILWKSVQQEPSYSTRTDVSMLVVAFRNFLNLPKRNFWTKGVLRLCCIVAGDPVLFVYCTTSQGDGILTFRGDLAQCWCLNAVRDQYSMNSNPLTKYQLLELTTDYLDATTQLLCTVFYEHSNQFRVSN
jgi:hypothetical protein